MSKNNSRKKPARRARAETDSKEVCNHDELPLEGAVKQEDADSFSHGGDSGVPENVNELWLRGKWSALCEVGLREIAGHPERRLIALLVGSAYMQIGDYDSARKNITQAVEWGCPVRDVARVLLASVHHILGEIAALRSDDKGAEAHFMAAVALPGKSQHTMASHERSVMEMARLGLLPQAATLVESKLTEMEGSSPGLSKQTAYLDVLRSEMELLRQELSLAQQRGQLFRHSGEPSENSPRGGRDGLGRLKEKSVSQLGQDLWVLEMTGYKKGGYFIEFGATDGVMLSNTWLLEKEFGWSGLCAEPNPKYFSLLKKNRNCDVSDACISARTGETVQFLVANEFGTISKYKDKDFHAKRRNAYAALSSEITLQTVSLNDFLVENNAPRQIDYMSIDTEGSEYDIIKEFPFDEWEIKLFTIEHNYSDIRDKIYNLMSSHGYRRIEVDFDDWYVLED